LNEIAKSFGVSVVYDWLDVTNASVPYRYCPILPVTIETAYRQVLAPTGARFEWISERMIAILPSKPLEICQDDDENLRAPPCDSQT